MVGSLEVANSSAKGINKLLHFLVAFPPKYLLCAWWREQVFLIVGWKIPIKNSCRSFIIHFNFEGTCYGGKKNLLFLKVWRLKAFKTIYLTFGIWEKKNRKMYCVHRAQKNNPPLFVLGEARVFDLPTISSPLETQKSCKLSSPWRMESR